MNKKKHIHFTGIKGVGMTPLAIIAKEAGFHVTGSDVADIFITDDALAKAGIVPFIGFSPDHVADADIVIITGAHGGIDNIEAKTAKELGKEVILQGIAVGKFMDGLILDRSFTGISIAGSHGKTTTTAMIATLLSHAKMDPSYVIGTSAIPSLSLPGHFGKGKYFIAEADEYATEPKFDKTTKFLWQHPNIAVFTNIELDHTDVYPTLEDLTKVFQEFAESLPENGILVANGDSREVRKILQHVSVKKITYGFQPENDYYLSRVSPSGNQTFFTVETRDAMLGEFTVQVPGEHNALNALASIIVGIEAGISLPVLKEGIKTFCGSKRRAEYIGELPSGAKLYDDYAHHPTEISQTLKAFRKQFPKEEIVAIFQPHTYSRTKMLFEDFLRSFTDADTIIISDIYSSMREEPDPSISSQILVEAMKTHHKHPLYLPNAIDVVKYLDENPGNHHTVIITMGAGDIYKIADTLIAK